MSRQRITDGNGRTLGYISDGSESGGKMRATNANGRPVGYYDTHTDKTYDANNRFVGTGNQLASLIADN